jgi:hypothetical protein
VKPAAPAPQGIQPTPLPRFVRAVLDRPIPVAGYNLAGRIEVGVLANPDPRTTIQDRAWWVKSIELLPSGWVRVTDENCTRLMSPSAVAWLE